MIAPALDLDAILADPGTKIIICCGAGGVGKTTTSAALGLRAAEAGRKVAVLTIDPARRLAQSLGVGELNNIPRPVRGINPANGGTLDAMMLDMKRTFDEVVIAHSTPQRAAAIFENPFYQALSSQFSGTQEYMAMEKLGQLHAEAEEDGRWDLIVVDTPPARSALDFLDAPEHLSSLLDGRFLRILLAPAKGPFKIMSAGFGLVSAALNKVLGSQILTDVQTFVNAFEALFGGFRQRAMETLKLLSSEHTTFIVVATAEHDALREAAFFVDRLSEEQMPLAGVVVNRVHASSVPVSAERALALAEDIERTTDDGETSVTAEALRAHAALMQVIGRERLMLKRFSATRPEVSLAEVAALPTDVTDLVSLRRVGALLADQP
jgi:anion-transporting  ArsA/GET3 family ATPase